MRRLLLTLLPLMVLYHMAFSQIIITGKVTDETGQGLPSVTILIKGTTKGVQTNADGNYRIEVSSEKSVLIFRFLGYTQQEIHVGKQSKINIQMQPEVSELSEVVVTAFGIAREKRALGYAVSTINVDKSRRTWNNSGSKKSKRKKKGKRNKKNQATPISDYEVADESYAHVDEGGFQRVNLNPLSTFSIDVDRASYSNIRRILGGGDAPPTDAVRVEEMINYFRYGYDLPKNDRPFDFNAEYAECPWAPNHKLLKVGLKAMEFEQEEIPMRNLTFLVDESGSMDDPKKLPLVKKTMKLLTQNLNKHDRVSIVGYSEKVRILLKPTSGDHKARIFDAIDELYASGGTRGGGALKVAYRLAEENFKKRGVNRIVLATDGDFNIGPSSDQAMEKLIERKRESGVFLTALGFGYGNLKDSKLEILADKGNGNYAYIDDFKEAKRVVMDEINSTLITVAKDVKLQVEFNPSKVAAYRLIGYENRALADEDFNDDEKDAGEMGAGHEVTALYEIIPVGVKSKFIKRIDRLKYSKLIESEDEFGDELATVKVRYKKPDEDESIKFSHIVLHETGQESTSSGFRLAAGVAMFGMLLKDSKYKGDASYKKAKQLVTESLGQRADASVSELLDLIDMAAVLKINN